MFHRQGKVPRNSPDGRWVAYESNESGAIEVFVRAYPGADQRTQVSVGGGHDAVWARDGRELFYRNGERFFAVPVIPGARFAAGAPELVFEGPSLDSWAQSYDVSRDGRRFLVVHASDEERSPRRLHVVRNWFEEVKRKVPGRQGAGIRD